MGKSGEISTDSVGSWGPGQRLWEGQLSSVLGNCEVFRICLINTNRKHLAN